MKVLLTGIVAGVLALACIPANTAPRFDCATAVYYALAYTPSELKALGAAASFVPTAEEIRFTKKCLADRKRMQRAPSNNRR